MNYLPMNTLGALEVSPKVIQFGIFLPGVDAAKGYAVSVKIIHETDQYLQAAGREVHLKLAFRRIGKHELNLKSTSSNIFLLEFELWDAWPE
jgi:hypothetical protein